MTSAPARNLPALLQGLREQGYTGTVRVSGAPGGTIHLRDGLVGAIETPGAPTAVSTLLASGRVDDETWLAACAAEPDADRLGAGLVADGLIGAGELQVICTAAMFDAAFAMSLNTPGSWELGDREPAFITEPGVEPRRLTEETTRRMALLGRLWGSPGELVRVRPMVTGSASASAGTGAAVGGLGDGRLARRYEDVLGVVTGRRTARDISFALGRGLFAVVLDLMRMQSLGLVEWQAQAAPGGRPSTAPRVLPGRTSAVVEPSGTPPLPRRRPGGAFPAEESGEKGG
ncbi:hypothetical protein OK074_6389 [Actinobacteria bacterium OK074]|nr:hypothetical protein OK074_6389 [Actinobacteria bacterium OK074]